MITRFIIAACGAVLILAVGYFGALGGGRPDAGVAAAMERELQALVDEALAGSDLSWAQVEMDGQTAVLRGEAPRDEERSQARTLVLRANGAGGFWRGGVVGVRDESTLAPPLSPYVFVARREGARVVLSGASPSKPALNDLTTYARQLFPGGVLEDVRIARGAPDDLSWENAARIAVTQLSNLRSGSVSITDRLLVVDGVVDNDAALGRVERDAASLPSIFAVDLQVEVSSPGGGELAGAARRESQPIATTRECERVLREALGTDVVRFEPDRAAITKESYPILDRLIGVARRCTAARVTVVGRVARVDEGDESNGGATGGDSAPAGVELWRQRAQAVADYFVLKGVAPDRALTDVIVVEAGRSGVVFRVAS